MGVIRAIHTMANIMPKIELSQIKIIELKYEEVEISSTFVNRFSVRLFEFKRALLALNLKYYQKILISIFFNS